jgi:hypothetical protein
MKLGSIIVSSVFAIGAGMAVNAVYPLFSTGWWEAYIGLNLMFTAFTMELSRPDRPEES